MKYLISILFLSFGISAVCQEKTYFDENFKSINKSTYQEKCRRTLFKCLEYKTDTYAINKILFKYKFGNLDSDAYNQVRNLLMRDSKTEIPNNSIIVIKYYDSILGFESEYNKHIKHEREYENSKKDTSGVKMHYHEHEFNKKTFETNRTNWINYRNKCLKKFDGKGNTEIFHMFKHSDAESRDFKGFKWIDDKGTFKNVFFQIMYNFNLVIIKPNGEYFLSGGHLSDKTFEKLIKNDNWSKYKKDWKKSMTTHEIYGKGMFVEKYSTPHKKHCF